VGALEAKKLYMFSGWSLERCELFAIEDRKSNSQLENSLFSREDFVDAFFGRTHECAGSRGS
jgi:hypothetical protein